MTDAIPPIPELYWDGIQFYLPARDDDGTPGYAVMYPYVDSASDGNGAWAYQGWTDAPSEDCPVVRVVTAAEETLMTPDTAARVDEELTIEDWSWSQVPPPVLELAPARVSRTHVVIGMADPANGVDEDGSMAWTPRRLTPAQARLLASALIERADAIEKSP